MNPTEEFSIPTESAECTNCHSRWKRHRKHRSAPGSPPGVLVSRHEDNTSVEVLAYSADRTERFKDVSFEKLRDLGNDFDVVWVRFVGLENMQLIKQCGETFGIHTLTLEDILNVHQRAKFETFDNYDFFVLRMARLHDSSEADHVETDQLSVLLTDKFVVSFEQRTSEDLQAVGRRIEENAGTIRTRQADYLAYALIDSVVDHYLPILDRLGEQVAEFEELLISEDAPLSVKDIHQLRREFLSLSRDVRPHRDMVGRILREPCRISESTRVFLGDCHDNVLHLSESIDVNRDVCSDLRSYHLALVGNRTNEVMKTLTIVSAVFIPLSFIAGLYGMNFEYMPELKWNAGYFITLGVMATIASGLLLWFRKKGWFEG